MDWNWFFSALAQSTAAIVGLITAFIITKIITNQTEFGKNKNNMGELLIEALRFKELAEYRRFDWLIKEQMTDAMILLDKLLKDTGNSKIAEDCYTEINFPLYKEKGKVLIEIRSAKNSYPASHPLAMAFTSSGQLVDVEEESIKKLYSDIKQNIRKISVAVGNMASNPESSNLIRNSLYAVNILFYIGVIYPLSFLPLKVNAEITYSLFAFIDILFSIKGLMLSTVSIIYSGIAVVFLYINSSLKYNLNSISKLSEFSRIDSYSKYLKIMEDNLTD